MQNALTMTEPFMNDANIEFLFFQWVKNIKPLEFG